MKKKIIIVILIGVLLFSGAVAYATYQAERTKAIQKERMITLNKRANLCLLYVKLSKRSPGDLNLWVKSNCPELVMMKLSGKLK